MSTKVIAWDRQEPCSEASIRDAFRAESLSPYAWSNGPGDRYGVHSHDYDKVLYCARGSITFVVNGRDVHMEAGDRLDLPAGTAHAAIVGPSGVTCLEAHR